MEHDSKGNETASSSTSGLRSSVCSLTSNEAVWGQGSCVHGLHPTWLGFSSLRPARAGWPHCGPKVVPGS